MLNTRLCDGCYIFYDEIPDDKELHYIVRVYIRNTLESLSADEILSDVNTIGYLLGYINPSEITPEKLDFVVLGLYSFAKPGSNQGTIMLGWAVLNILESARFKRNKLVKHVLLDDDTGRDADPDHNIYYKLGFNVKDENYPDRWISWDQWLRDYRRRLPHPSDNPRMILLTDLAKNISKYLSSKK